MSEDAPTGAHAGVVKCSFVVCLNHKCFACSCFASRLGVDKCIPLVCSRSLTGASRVTTCGTSFISRIGLGAHVQTRRTGSPRCSARAAMRPPLRPPTVRRPPMAQLLLQVLTFASLRCETCFDSG